MRVRFSYLSNCVNFYFIFYKVMLYLKEQQQQNPAAEIRLLADFSATAAEYSPSDFLFLWYNTCVRRNCTSSVSRCFSLKSWFCLLSKSTNCWAVAWQCLSSCCNLEKKQIKGLQSIWNWSSWKRLWGLQWWWQCPEFRLRLKYYS